MRWWTARLNAAMDLLPRPLDPVRSIKLKLGLALLASGAAGLAVFSLYLRHIPIRTSVTAILVALATSQVLAHGMTSPLREMTAAARAMARGDYSRRVRATSRDEVGELASAFNSMSDDLAAADQHRRELIANVSHELRTPITALQGQLENIVDGVAEPDPAALRTALQQTERLGRLVTELLDLSRLDAGVTALQLVEVDVAEFLTAAVREAAVTASGAGRDVRFTLRPPAGAVRVQADPGRLHQVLANLLDNGARHSPAGAVVGVEAWCTGDRLVLDVTDRGTGIPPGQRARVFERFTRGERPTDRGGGTGLGLAIARWVVELHGGSIGVLEADPPGGCRIRVTLPGVAPAERQPRRDPTGTGEVGSRRGAAGTMAG